LIEWDTTGNRRLNLGTGLNPKESNLQGLGRPTIPARYPYPLLPSNRINSVYCSQTMRRQGEGVRSYSSHSHPSLGYSPGLTKLAKLRSEFKLLGSVSNIYPLLLDETFLLAAYNKLSNNTGAFTPGVGPETLNGTSLAAIIKTISQLKDHSFQFKPSRRSKTPPSPAFSFYAAPCLLGSGSNGTKKPLENSSPRDQIVQQAMLMILEAIYENSIFFNSSHGYRPNRGCHTALQEVSS
jgi:hypothetical protein